MADKQALYFGYGPGGHFLRGKDGWRDCGGHPGNYAPGFPWESAAWLDGSLLKNMKVTDWPDGRVYTVGGGREHFWFAFVWWDRSGDKRGASNYGFYVRGFGVPVRETYDAIAPIVFEFACSQWPDVALPLNRSVPTNSGGCPPIPRSGFPKMTILIGGGGR